jgi:hypothetical protein
MFQGHHNFLLFTCRWADKASPRTPRLCSWQLVWSRHRVTESQMTSLRGVLHVESRSGPGLSWLFLEATARFQSPWKADMCALLGQRFTKPPEEGFQASHSENPSRSKCRFFLCSIYVCMYVFLRFWGWTQGLTLTKQALYHFFLPLAFLGFVNFSSDRVLHFCPGWPRTHDPPTSITHVVVTTNMHHHVWLHWLRWGLINFLPNLDSNSSPPTLCLLSGWDYMHVPQLLIFFFHFFTAGIPSDLWIPKTEYMIWHFPSNLRPFLSIQVGDWCSSRHRQLPLSRVPTQHYRHLGLSPSWPSPVLCSVGWSAAPPSSTSQIPMAIPLCPIYNNQKCSQTPLNVPWGKKSSKNENLCSRESSRMEKTYSDYSWYAHSATFQVPSCHMAICYKETVLLVRAPFKNGNDSKSCYEN